MSSINSIAFKPVTASILLTPEETLDSLKIVNIPISPVLDTWVPPHSSTEKPSPIDKTLTSSSYFSPNIASAPDAIASSSCINSVFTSALLRVC